MKNVEKRERRGRQQYEMIAAANIRTEEDVIYNSIL